MIWVRLCVLYANTYILLSTQKGVLEVVLRFYNVGAKWVKWKRGYKYIRSGRKGRVSVENTHSFFVHDIAPSMYRNCHGSIPRSNRYRIAIDRGRPDTLEARAPGHHAH
jgi:hypothetical protein